MGPRTMNDDEQIDMEIVEVEVEETQRDIDVVWTARNERC